MVENKDVVTFEDAESTNINFNQDKQTFKSIILSHLNNILKYASCEFRGGYWEERPVIVAGGSTTTDIYVEDSREKYSNAVEAFADALYPYFDKKMKDSEAECIKELERQHFLYTIEVEIEIGDKKYIDRQFKNPNQKHFYRESRVKISRVLFRALCDFLHRKKYLEVGTLED